jgi:hypothetical protein
MFIFDAMTTKSYVYTYSPTYRRKTKFGISLIFKLISSKKEIENMFLT